jgi:hypothetical protein
VHALRNIHAALIPHGLLVDTQPVSALPRVSTKEMELGTLDMRAWINTIHDVDQRFAETINAGLYSLEHEQRFVVADRFADGPECLETVGSWRDTQVPPSVTSRLETTQTAVTVEQEVRLRLLRVTEPAVTWAVDGG